MRTILTLLLSSTLLVSCGGRIDIPGDDAGPPLDGSTDAPNGDVSILDGAPADATGPFDYCGESAARASKCGDGFDPDRCKRDLACHQGVIRDDELWPLLACIARRSCDTRVDSCVEPVAAKHASEPAVQDFTKACLDTRAACPDFMPSDWCATLGGIVDEAVLAKLRSCFGRPCSDAMRCIRDTLASYGCRT